MKTNKLGLMTIVILFLTGLQMQGQEYTEFAPVGVEWYYTYTSSDPLASCSKYRVEKDTLIDESLCKMVIRSLDRYNDYYNNLDTIIFKQDGGKIYYYCNGQFNLIYNYDVRISEEVVFTFRKYDMEENTVSLAPVKCTVKDIQQIEINGRQYKQFFTTIDTSFGDAWFFSSDHNYNYIEQIGHPDVFMEGLKTVINLGVYTTELRCYIEETFHYITTWWQKYNLPCDTLVYNNGPGNITPMRVNTNQVVIYPNPVQDELHLLCHESQNPVSGEIFSLTGQSLIRFNIENQNKVVNVHNLSSGIYFLKYQIDNKSIIRKIIKQ
jgi:hypothetical protein